MTLHLDKGIFEKDLVRAVEYLGGVQYCFRFENGFGASVVKNAISHGHEEDLWEIAFVRWIGDDEFTILDYDDAEVSEDSFGYLTNDQVLKLLERIKSL